MAQVTTQTSGSVMNKAKVEILGFSDYKQVALTLYESFQNDLLSKYLTIHLAGNPDLKKRAEIALFEAYAYSHMLKGLVVGIRSEDGKRFETVAVWARPDSGNMENFWTLVRSGYLKYAWLTGAEGRDRLFNGLFPLLHKTSHEVLGQAQTNTWSLIYLGSTPEARGKGNARAMFDFMFENYIDKKGCLSYLESSSSANIPIYEKFGYKLVKQIVLGDPVDKDKDFAAFEIMVRGPMGKQWEGNP